MSADNMTRAELIEHHATRVREAVRQAHIMATEGWPESVAEILDRLVFNHAREAAHAARTMQRICGRCAQ
jgi:hypothetical protein